MFYEPLAVIINYIWKMCDLLQSRACLWSIPNFIHKTHVYIHDEDKEKLEEKEN